MASAVASLSSPPAMGVKWSNGVTDGWDFALGMEILSLFENCRYIHREVDCTGVAYTVTNEPAVLAAARPATAVAAWPLNGFPSHARY